MLFGVVNGPVPPTAVAGVLPTLPAICGSGGLPGWLTPPPPTEPAPADSPDFCAARLAIAAA